jgi:hypothetical protein
VILLFLFGVIMISVVIGAVIVFFWGDRLLGRDNAQARAIRAVIEINRRVIDARSRLLDEALRGRRHGGRH